MTLIKYLVNIIIVVILLVATSCEEYLDVNQNPNQSASAEAGPIFTQVLVNISTNRANDIGSSGACAQLWSGGGSFGAGVFTSPEQYNFSIFTTGNTWRTWYRDAQKDLKLAIANSEEAGQTNAIAQCEIVSALVYYWTTMLWEKVPYTQAVDIDVNSGEILTRNPRFDEQSVVLQGVIDLIDQALARIDDSPTSITSGDLVYGGDMEKWRKFAKSIKFRTLMTLVDAEPERSSQLASMINEADMISSSEESAEFPFFDEPGNKNPFYTVLEAFAGGSNFFYFASEAMVDLMKSRNDPRIDEYFSPYPGGGSPPSPTGAPPGVTNIGFAPWVLSTANSAGTSAVVRPDAPDVYFSVQEQLFLEAEAIAMGYAPGGLAKAQELVIEGIKLAMSNYGVPGDDVTRYINNEVPDFTSSEQAQDFIGEQFFIDSVQRWIEGWTHWRRIEIPSLSIPDGASTGDSDENLLRRLPYPPDEIAANENAESDPDLDAKMYFDN